MGLEAYRRKRRFERTPEPSGAGKARDGRALAFTVQRHAARTLHYDFRLEWGGALKSWAVPKGPSLDPREKRLAVHVEDHPLEYGTFEGEIPKGEYGGGTVTLWDRGTWVPEGDPAASYRKGHLKFRLDGRKLRGRWDLIRLRRSEPGKENWLLIKGKDEHALDATAIPGAREAPMPRELEPQLCALVAAAPEGDEWLHEFKLDGYRLLCRLEDGRARLFTRRGNDWTSRFPKLAAAIERLPLKSALLDGEVVALDERARPSFQALQNELDERRPAELTYFIFDLLYLDGRDLRDATLLERKKALAALLRSPPEGLRYCDHVLGNGGAFFREACRLSFEGVVSKRADAPYRGGRGKLWLKAKCLLRQEFTIGGFTGPGGSRSHFGALLLGARDKSGLRYVGKVGTGFTEASLKSLYRKLSALGSRSSPFSARVPEHGVHWVEPKLVCEVAFSEWTDEGIVRQARFEGLREDKSADDVRVEKPKSAAAASPSVALTHPDRVVYPDRGVTKRDLADYYAAVAPRMLPELAFRPLALVRCPSGCGGPCFFQKHVGDAFPEAVRGITITEKSEPRAYSFVEGLDGVLGLVQMNVLEIHPWGSKTTDLERPDRVVFDLDPGPGVAWKDVVLGALALRKLLSELGLESFVKTTGGKGLHVVVPLLPRADWDAVKAFAKGVAEGLARQDPERYTAQLAKAERPGRIFIDYLRNGRGATAVAPYSTRARAGATVAMPVFWDELREIKPDQFNVKNAPRRLADEDPWKDIREVDQSLREDAMAPNQSLRNRLRDETGRWPEPQVQTAHHKPAPVKEPRRSRPHPARNARRGKARRSSGSRPRARESARSFRPAGG